MFDAATTRRRSVVFEEDDELDVPTSSSSDPPSASAPGWRARPLRSLRRWPRCRAAIGGRVPGGRAAIRRGNSDRSHQDLARTDIRLLSSLGVMTWGRTGTRRRRPRPPSWPPRAELTWHFVGQLQINKAASVVPYADVIHSVDRLRLVDGARRGAPDGRPAGRAAWSRSAWTTTPAPRRRPGRQVPAVADGGGQRTRPGPGRRNGRRAAGRRAGRAGRCRFPALAEVAAQVCAAASRRSDDLRRDEW